MMFSLGLCKSLDPLTPVVFKSLGQAVQDLVGAKMVQEKVDLSDEENLKFPVPLWDQAVVAEKVSQST